MDAGTLAELVKAGGLAFYAVVATLAIVALWKSLTAERAARLADKDAFAERMLAMADQQKIAALESNKTTITNTAALEANRVAMDRVLTRLDRAGGG